MIAVFLLGTTGAIFSAAFPTAISASRQAQEFKVATAIAQRKMEQLRSMNYESLTRPLLTTAGVIDSADSGPYTFTSVDTVASQLTSGAGTLTITDVASGLKRVRVSVSWLSKSDAPRSIQMTSLIADKRPRAVN
jgi:type II secretory pathway pseudopilin PulG